MYGRKILTPRLSGENLTRLAVSTAFLTLTACSGGDQVDEGDLNELQNIPELAAAQAGELNAETDIAETKADTAVVVSILGNDTVAPDSQMRLDGSPENGKATLLATGEVEYTPNAGFEGTDRVEYVLIDADGNESRGTLYVAVVCSDCHITDTSTLDASELPYCLAEQSDPDGDGFGWEDNTSCSVPDMGAALSGLTAKSDSVKIKQGETKAIKPLSNDSIADRSKVRMVIETPPTEGTIEAVEAGIIIYTAPDNYFGSDSLVYSISDGSGDTSVASVEFNITCNTCTDYKALRLSWAANPDEENVDGYKVLFGADENPLTSTEVSDVKVPDGETPTVVFDLVEDLSLASNEGGCFMIQAYRGAKVSEPSDAACFAKGT